MSIIKGKPWIETLLDMLTNDNRRDILKELNYPGKQEVWSLEYSWSGTDVKSVYFNLYDNVYKSGILIYRDDIKALIAYEDNENLGMYVLDFENHTYEQINEPLTVNELHRYLENNKDFYYIRMQFEFEPVENTDIKYLSVTVYSYDRKAEVVKTINNSLNTHFTTNAELQAHVRSLDLQTQVQLFMMIALLGAFIGAGKGHYELTSKDDPEPATYMLIPLGYFYVGQIGYISGTGVSYLSTSVNNILGAQTPISCYVYSNALD